MEKDRVLQTLNLVKSGEISPADALIQFKTMPFMQSFVDLESGDIGFAKVDLQRGLRQGVSEVIFGQSKQPDQIIKIVKSMQEKGLTDILITRFSEQSAALVSKEIEMEYYNVAKIGIVSRTEKPMVGKVVIASGGTSDFAVCEEAALTLELFGNNVERLYDVGVAGLNRLLMKLDVLMSARVIIVVAGMEGALASVVGGLVDCPVIAVPTSVGYGASLGGISALLSMLNSCASGVSVVNIDNGFGAGYMANMINKMEGLN